MNRSGVMGAFSATELVFLFVTVTVGIGTLVWLSRSERGKHIRAAWAATDLGPAAGGPMGVMGSIKSAAGTLCFLAAGVLAFWWWTVQPPIGNDLLRASYAACRDSVPYQVITPGTLQMPYRFSRDVTTERLKAGNFNFYVVRSWFDSQNANGALVRTSFKCDVAWNGARWLIASFETRPWPQAFGVLDEVLQRGTDPTVPGVGTSEAGRQYYDANGNPIRK